MVDKENIKDKNDTEKTIVMRSGTCQCAFAFEKFKNSKGYFTMSLPFSLFFFLQMVRLKWHCQ